MKNLLIPLICILTIIIVCEVVYLSCIKKDNKVIPQQIVPTVTPSSYTEWMSKKPLLKESLLTDTSEGVISEIDTKGGQKEMNGRMYPYAFSITLTNENGNKHSYIYEGNDINKTTISSSESGKLDLSSLSPGDKVIITEVIDLVRKRDNIINIKIQKL